MHKCNLNALSCCHVIGWLTVCVTKQQVYLIKCPVSVYKHKLDFSTHACFLIFMYTYLHAHNTYTLPHLYSLYSYIPIYCHFHIYVLHTHMYACFIYFFIHYFLFKQEVNLKPGNKRATRLAQRILTQLYNDALQSQPVFFSSAVFLFWE